MFSLLTQLMERCFCCKSCSRIADILSFHYLKKITCVSDEFQVEKNNLGIMLASSKLYPIEMMISLSLFFFVAILSSFTDIKLTLPALYPQEVLKIRCRTVGKCRPIHWRAIGRGLRQSICGKADVRRVRRGDTCCHILLP